jgi:hypothetical protein
MRSSRPRADRLRANIAAMGSQNVPMAVEPAFQFKA